MFSSRMMCFTLMTLRSDTGAFPLPVSMHPGNQSSRAKSSAADPQRESLSDSNREDMFPPTSARGLVNEVVSFTALVGMRGIRSLSTRVTPGAAVMYSRSLRTSARAVSRASTTLDFLVARKVDVVPR